MADIQFRKSQQAILDYRGGQMGVSAVPGAGKTFTLSHLAAELVQRLSTRSVINEQEVLIVTFSNSAVNGFKSRISGILQHERGLLPYTGYRVRTLHGLAHDIVRERPALVGLSEDFQIVDDRQALSIRQDAVNANLPEWETRLLRFLSEDIRESSNHYVQNRALPDMLIGIVTNFISLAKEAQWTPHMLELQLDEAPAEFDLARFCTRVYGDYARSLSYRGAVDFDDLIRLALMALQTDGDYLERLRKRWVYILEDEAQDSSRLQEEMLKLLTGRQNWVRVGDPNQAINTTFTTADPHFLRDFLGQSDVLNQPLQVSGRSSQKILEMANELVRWTVQEHPVEELRREAFYFQEIQPTGKGDVQANPANDESNIYIHPLDQQMTPEKEVELVVKSLMTWLPENRDKTVAVLVPENSRGFKVAEALQMVGMEDDYEELLRSTTQTRMAATMLTTILRYLGQPNQPRLLSTVYRDVWLRIPQLSQMGTWPEDDDQSPPKLIEKAIGKLREVETLVEPVDDTVWDDLFEEMGIFDLPEGWGEDLEAFLRLIQRWLDALELPVDQLVLTIGQDVFHTPSDIALGYKIAHLLRGIANQNPSWRLTQFVEELRIISQNERKFIGFDDAETGYEPPPGKITIATMHAAKGLEWDRVYMLSVNNYSFPNAMPQDEYIGERWFVSEDLNLDSEVKAQLQALVENWHKKYDMGVASQQARIDYAAERLRLLYVGITRARRDLVIMWNTGRYWQKGGTAVKTPALPLYNLNDWLDEMGY